jgi:predicted acetyltransferase
MPVEIRTLRPEDTRPFTSAVRLGFLGDPDPAAEAAQVPFWERRVDLRRAWGAFDGGRCVATLRTHPFELSVPGGRTLSADGLTAVTVTPTHRRRGLLTTMLTGSLRAAADRGDPVSILIASEYPIYGRFGYAPVTEGATYEIDVRGAGFRRSATGTVELVEPDELRKLAPPVYERFRPERPGVLSRDDPRWDMDLGLDHPEGQPPRWKGRAVVHRDAAGEPDAYLRYHVDDSHEGRRSTAVLVVDELIAATPDGYADLWRYCLEVDLVRTVRAEDRPVDEPLPWLLTDARAARLTERADMLWLRLLDVPAALTGRGYRCAGRLVLEVVDPDGHAAGRFALDAGPDGATCVRTDATADLTLPATALATAYLGGFRLRALGDAGLLDEHRPGALADADTLFAAERVPWCNLWF